MKPAQVIGVVIGNKIHRSLYRANSILQIGYISYLFILIKKFISEVIK